MVTSTSLRTSDSQDLFIRYVFDSSLLSLEQTQRALGETSVGLTSDVALHVLLPTTKSRHHVALERYSRRPVVSCLYVLEGHDGFIVIACGF